MTVMPMPSVLMQQGRLFVLAQLVMKAMERTVLVSFIVCKTVTSYFMINVAIYRLYNRGRKKMSLFCEGDTSPTIIIIIIGLYDRYANGEQLSKTVVRRKILLHFQKISQIYVIFTQYCSCIFHFPNEVARFRVETSQINKNDSSQT